MDNIFVILQKTFFDRLQEKTSWGRNDLMKLYLECQVQVLGDAIPKELLGEQVYPKVPVTTFQPKVVNKPIPTPDSMPDYGHTTQQPYNPDDYKGEPPF